MSSAIKENKLVDTSSHYQLRPQLPMCGMIFIIKRTISILFIWPETICYREDTLLLESDLIFEDVVLQRILKDPYPSLALVAKYESWMDGYCCYLG